MPANLPYAMMEPVNVTAPIQIPNEVSTRSIFISTADFLASNAENPSSDFMAAKSIDAILTSSKCVLKPTNTAASPTNACIPATNSGI